MAGESRRRSSALCPPQCPLHRQFPRGCPGLRVPSKRAATLQRDAVGKAPGARERGSWHRAGRVRWFRPYPQHGGPSLTDLQRLDRAQLVGLLWRLALLGSLHVHPGHPGTAGGSLCHLVGWRKGSGVLRGKSWRNASAPQGCRDTSERCGLCSGARCQSQTPALSCHCPDRHCRAEGVLAIRSTAGCHKVRSQRALLRPVAQAALAYL